MYRYQYAYMFLLPSLRHSENEFIGKFGNVANFRSFLNTIGKVVLLTGIHSMMADLQDRIWLHKHLKSPSQDVLGDISVSWDVQTPDVEVPDRSCLSCARPLRMP